MSTTPEPTHSAQESDQNIPILTQVESVRKLRSVASIVEMQIRPPLEEAPFWQEVIAFNQLPSTVIDEFYGKYVAVYQGNIVDSDIDEGELALRFYRTFGYMPVYIHKVGTEEGLINPDDV